MQEFLGASAAVAASWVPFLVSRGFYATEVDAILDCVIWQKSDQGEHLCTGSGPLEWLRLGHASSKCPGARLHAWLGLHTATAPSGQLCGAESSR